MTPNPTQQDLQTLRTVLRRELANGKFCSVLNQIECGFAANYIHLAPVSQLQCWQAMAEDLMDALQRADRLPDGIAAQAELFTKKMQRCIRQEQRMPAQELAASALYRPVLATLHAGARTDDALAAALGTSRHAIDNKLTPLMHAQLVTQGEGSIYGCTARGAHALAARQEMRAAAR